MEKNGAAYSKVVQALTVVHSPHATAKDRSNAQKELDRIKSDPEGFDYGLSLYANETSVPTRHFGLQLIENCITESWNQLPFESQNRIKTTLLNLVSTETEILGGSRLLKEKLCQVTVEAIKRSWPQEWPSLIPDLTTLTNLGPSQANIVFIILRTLSEDVLVFESSLPQVFVIRVISEKEI